MAGVPTVRHRRIAAELRRLREASGLSAEEVVTRLDGLNMPKLSRYENARTNPRPEVVEALLTLYGCDPELKQVLLDITKDKDRRGWWQGYKDALNPLYTDLITLESTALGIKSYEASFIPGLFQTRAYARSIISKLALSTVGVEAMVDVRVARQAVLTRTENPVAMWAVVHESALSINAGEGVMADQLARLVDVSHLPNVQIQVLEATSRPHPGMDGAFTLLEFPQRDLDLVLTGGLIASDWVEDTAHVDVYRAAFNELMASALGTDDSREFLIAKKAILT
ncbi:helix-turn-helix domain-containing protein [Kitasatospora indigofera]|uniref:helix-turn-helix domain-containing protein n=1 Tax=Kitasatospora indigofera TaxID=67307 RepID=UPI0036B1A27E